MGQFWDCACKHQGFGANIIEYFLKEILSDGCYLAVNFPITIEFPRYTEGIQIQIAYRNICHRFKIKISGTYFDQSFSCCLQEPEKSAQDTME